MFEALRSWRRRRVLAQSAIPDALWREALDALPFLALYTADELARLRDLCVLFLDAKGIVGARGHAVTPLQRVMIAQQACVLVLNLDLSLYDGFENVVVYPDEFVPGWEWEDEAGVVHKHDEPLAGEAMPNGPVVLSWPDVAAAADWHASGMNLVVHEFAHKLDMASGAANGCPPLPPDLDAGQWRATLAEAYDDFAARVDRDEDTAIDPYAAESPGEFFAVLSEVFFADPGLLRDEYPRVYALLARFYRQDPAARAALGPAGE
ncbi:MAG TPA: M90 family metallopeptidase [Casimicrobiaceae bacterium]|nr:M90 family metallopeptidase [Casimicrobiaceae bacterium]